MENSELKPCPFEKAGEHHHVNIDETRPGHGYIWCSDCEFSFPYEKEPKIDQLIERWNTRTERTCELKQDGDCWYVCTACKAIYLADVNVAHYKFCPECGARVVRE